MLIQYTPTRSIVGDGSDYQIEAKLKRYDCSDRPEGKEHKALSGKTEYTVYRLEEEYLCQTVPLKLTYTDLARWREFKRSCAFGEFLFSMHTALKPLPIFRNKCNSNINPSKSSVRKMAALFSLSLPFKLSLNHAQ
ncbi:hypothetical protein P3339_09565 [Microbulbifer sp. MLAF003]|uniref:hypothetical protein n=1 Tax=Microbulbifer sp. MLAF003 TaxID=3032582 RepID=UPI0024ADA1E9|nr:hypothetical protein [Microbulbifer sp. MLAF003]WHI52988.1 hypothetical protein P3339_09565 [Microbulbifer sp. MLAF003]